MTTHRPVTTVVTTTVAGLLLAAAPASAAPDWGTLEEFDLAQIQACKDSVADGEVWRFRLRITTGDRRAHGRVRVLEDHRATDRVWRSGPVPADSVSGVGSVRFPRGERRWNLLTYLETRDGGVSTSGLRARAVRRC